MKTFFTALLAIIPTGLLIWTNEMSLAVVVLILAAILDTITGIVKGCWCGTFKTSIIWDKGLKKFIRLTIAIFASYLLEVIGQSGQPLLSFIAGSFCLFLMSWAILEVLSIFENLDDMGLQTPKSFIKHIRRNIEKDKCEHIEK